VLARLANRNGDPHKKARRPEGQRVDQRGYATSLKRRIAGAISARIEDEAWLERFQSRQIDVRPGDALHCDVRIEHLYGHDNELISERYAIVKVRAVLADSFRQQELDLGGSA
jgi:hypothetical protein